MQDAEHLRQLLSKGFALGQQRNSSAPELPQRLSELRQRLSPPRGRHSLPRIAQGVLAFRIQGRETPYPHLKYACYGVARPTDWNNRLIIEDQSLLLALLDAVAAQKHISLEAYKACCRALQTSRKLDLATTENLSHLAHKNIEQLDLFLQNASR